MNCEKCESVKEYCEEEIENDTPYLTKYDKIRVDFCKEILNILEPKENVFDCGDYEIIVFPEQLNINLKNGGESFGFSKKEFKILEKAIARSRLLKQKSCKELGGE